MKLDINDTNQIMNVLINDQKKNHLLTTKLLFCVNVLTIPAIIVTPNPVRNIVIKPLLNPAFLMPNDSMSKEVKCIRTNIIDHFQLIEW